MANWPADPTASETPAATALCDFAAQLERELRGGDTLARVGGEEFAVILFGVDLDDAVAFAARIGAELAGSAGAQLALSASARATRS
jgi:diguanylate cyclase (GGDEF)-like protein